MKDRDFLDRFDDCLDLRWELPPEDVEERAEHLPAGNPLPSPAVDASMQRTLPGDVRSKAPGQLRAPSGFVTVRLPGVDTTLSVEEPKRGRQVWIIRGRVWLSPRTDGEVRVVLAAEDRVLAYDQIHHGDSFEFRDILGGNERLEFHLPDASVAVLNLGER